MSHLDDLEAQSIYLLREAHAVFKKPGLLWSMGKDSNVLLWLTKKAFGGHVPYPVIHIDTTYEFPEMLEFRAWAEKHYGFQLIVHVNQAARDRGIGYETTDPVTVTHELKTVALQQVLAQHGFDALITGIRRDEDSTRAKERYFSPRNAEFEWDYKDQPPEFWGQFATGVKPGEHIRVQPLLDWTEIDIWRYCEREKIPLPGMYFARDGKRYRSLGCWPITKPVASQAGEASQASLKVSWVDGGFAASKGSGESKPKETTIREDQRRETGLGASSAVVQSRDIYERAARQPKGRGGADA